MIKGVVIGASTLVFEGLISVEVVEVRAILEGLLLAVNNGWLPLCIESDALGVKESQLTVVHETINVGTETAASLKAQTEQMNRIVNELDSIHFSINWSRKLVATDKCIMALLFLIVIGVVVIIIVKSLFYIFSLDIRDIPGLAPPAQTQRLLWNAT
ncbi:hypothetical protein Q3G72_001784 [Acer saccharum]|nr:hypothetical protein Q3G72_001784 [Acer saccharum]